MTRLILRKIAQNTESAGSSLLGLLVDRKIRIEAIKNKFKSYLPKLNSFTLFGHSNQELDLAYLSSGADHGDDYTKDSGLSWRWLTASILISTIAIVMITGALYAAVDHYSEIIARKDGQTSQSNLINSGNILNKANKSDRFVFYNDEPSENKIVISIPMEKASDDDDSAKTDKFGASGKKVIFMKPFIHLKAPLAAENDGNTKIPALNIFELYRKPVKFVKKSYAPSSQIVDAMVDGSIFVKTEPLINSPEVISSPEMGDRQAKISVLNQLSSFYGKVNSHDIKNTNANEAEHNKDSTVIIRTSNITKINKAPVSDNKPHNYLREEFIKIGRIKNIAEIIIDKFDFDQQSTRNIINPLVLFYPTTNFTADTALKIKATLAEDKKKSKPLAITIYKDGKKADVTIAETDNGNFLLRLGGQKPNQIKKQTKARARGTNAITLYSSIYVTANKHGLNNKLADKLVRLFMNYVNLQRHVGPNDSIELLYAKQASDQTTDKTSDADNKTKKDDSLLFANLTINGKEYKLYLFNSADGYSGYYDEKGFSPENMLLRKPMPFGRITSGFGYRRHPLTGVVRMHTGIDWGAPRGTIVVAAGSGKIIKRGWHGSYGNHIKIQHTNGYITAYSHMSRFAKGISIGSNVVKGQVIGYVGSTGSSTGNHLHYEVKVNGKFTNPLKVRIPKATKLAEKAKNRFIVEQARLDSILNTNRLVNIAGR